MHRSISVILSLLLVSLSFQGNAQNYELVNDMEVIHNGISLPAAWAGGLTAPQFSTVDLNGDAIQDLVVFDRADNRLLTFINGGTNGQIDYTYAPEYQDVFPDDLTNWMLMRDYDGDGYMDIFTSNTNSSNIRVFKNRRGDWGFFTFSLVKDTLKTEYPPVLNMYCARSDIPAIDDIDGDGDLDILTFHIGGSLVEWHRNQSMEIWGDREHLEFKAQSRCFGHFEEDSQTCAAFINLPPCSTGQRLDQSEMAAMTMEPADGGAHVGSTLLSLDLTGDGLRELLIGDVSCTRMYALRNAGTTAIAHFDYEEEDYPSNGVSVDVLDFPAAFFLDVNNDGLKDLVTAPNSTTDVEDQRGTMLHLNVGTNAVPDFQFSHYGFLQEDMVEMGSGLAPAFFDHNADGLMDMLVASWGRTDSMGNLLGGVYLYENTGNAQQAAFTLVDTDYLGFGTNAQLAGYEGLIPAMGDLDNDGDDDLLMGNYDGTILYFENTAPVGGTATFNLVNANYFQIDLVLGSAPALHDLDGDNDLDLVIGDYRGRLHYYRNQGGVANPNFVLQSDTFGQIKINDFSGDPFTNGFARPHFADIDNDQDPELLVGTVEGEVEVFEDVSTLPGAAFSPMGKLYDLDFGAYAAVAVAEIDTTGLRYYIGNFRGGINSLKDTGPVGLTEATEQSLWSMSLSPNPARDQVDVLLTHPQGRAGRFALEVFTPQGQLVYQSEVRTGQVGRLALGALPQGLYFVKASDGKQVMVERLLLMR